MSGGTVLALWRLRSECAIYYRATRVAIKLHKMICRVKIRHPPVSVCMNVCAWVCVSVCRTHCHCQLTVLIVSAFSYSVCQ